MVTHNVKPQDTITGVWVSHKDGDVHNYIHYDGSLVIGWNKSYKDKVDFSDLALVAEPGVDQLWLQYAGDNGNPQSVKVSGDTWVDAIHGMLEGLKAKALKHKQQLNEI